MTTKVEYYPPQPIGGVLTFEFQDGAEFQGAALDGLGPVSISPVTLRSPGQAGVTAVDVLVPARIVVVQAFSQYADPTTLWTKRRTLSRALTVQQPQTELVLGRLRVHRDGMPTYEIDSLPRSPSFPVPRGWGRIPIDIEFYCPSPYWKDLEDSSLTLESESEGVELDESGFELDDAGFEFEGNDVEQEVVNEGDVPAPIVARLYGEVTTPRLLNVTTGETIEITGDVAADEYIEVNTAFARNTIELVEADGTRTSIMDRLNLDLADFWQLQPGSNVVRFEADANVSGRALVTWRQLYGGL